MHLLEFLGLQPKQIQVFAFVGPSGTGKSFRAKLVAQRYGIRAIIDDGLLIYDDEIISGHSAKLEQTYMGAVRIALFDGKEERDEAARAIRRLRLKKLLILGTSEKMAGKIATRLQLPPIQKFIHIEELATKEQMEQARRSRIIEGKHVIPVRSNEVKKGYTKIFVNAVRVSLTRKKWLARLFPSAQAPNEPSANAKQFEKSVVRPEFSRVNRKDIPQAALARMTEHYTKQYHAGISLKKLSVSFDASGYRLVLTVDIPFGQQLTAFTGGLKTFITDMIEKVTGTLIEDIAIIVDKILPPQAAI
ncbi:MAG: hypothetical protein K2O09_03175 [Treponemataceae bacterium]|nr:hypothetical protein [Treponemataceae bacterium]